MTERDSTNILKDGPFIFEFKNPQMGTAEISVVYIVKGNESPIFENHTIKIPPEDFIKLSRGEIIARLDRAGTRIDESLYPSQSS